MSEKAGDEVEQLLQSWGLADLNAKFKSNYIVIQAFEYLTEEDIIELIPKIGQRAIFRGRLHQWRQENNITGFKQSHPAPNISVKFTETKESEVSLKPEPPKQSSPQLVQNILKIVKEEPVDNETKIQPQANCPPKTIPQTPDCPPKTLPQTPKLPENPLSGYIKKPIKQIVPKPLNKPQIKVLATRSEIQSQIKVLSTKSPAIPKPPATPKLPATPKQIQQSLGPTIPQGNHPINDMKIQHKVYGTLTMCNQNVKQLISPKPTAIQSKVQQFYISPVVDAPSSPPLAVQPFVQIHTQPTINLEHSPFVTSIIRVETSNCEKGSTSNEPLNNQQKKVNRTTILQKLTSTLPAKAIAHQQTSPKIPTVHHNSPQSQISTGQTTSLMMENYVDLEHGPLYPIVKMETNLSESNWEEYTEPQMEVNPEPLPQSEAVAGRNPDHTADEVMAEFTDDKEDSLDTDSAHELDSENDNTNSLLKRMPQKVASRSKGKTKVVNNPRKLDIRNILMSSVNGRHVLNFYETHERLDVTRRRMLVESIVQECWDTNRRITLSDCIELAEEIIEILPNENKENYYSARRGKTPRSPIYNKYRRLHNKHFLENRTPVISRRNKKPRLSLLEIDDDVEADDSIIIS